MVSTTTMIIVSPVVRMSGSEKVRWDSITHAGRPSTSVAEFRRFFLVTAVPP